MITSAPGDPIWLRAGVLLITNISDSSGLPVGRVLRTPRRGIFLDRKIVKNISYIKAYVENIGERLIEEDEVQEFMNGDSNAD
jgi:hypothetical protein